MGLKGVPGLRLATAPSVGGRAPKENLGRETDGREPTKRMRHQGPPGFTNNQQHDVGESPSSHGANGADAGRGDKGGRSGGHRQRTRGTSR